MVQGTANSARFLFRAFNLDDLSAGIVATGRADMVGQLRTMTLGTIVQRRSIQTKVAAPLTLTRLGVFPFR